MTFIIIVFCSFSKQKNAITGISHFAPTHSKALQHVMLIAAKWFCNILTDFAGMYQSHGPTFEMKIRGIGLSSFNYLSKGIMFLSLR